MPRLYVVLLVLCAFACQSDETRCRARLETLEAKVAQLARLNEGYVFGASAAIAPIANRCRLVDLPGPLVEVRGTHVELDGRNLGELGSDLLGRFIANDLATADKNHVILHPDATALPPPYVIAPPDMPVDELLRIVTMFPRPDVARLVVRRPAAPPPDALPPRASPALRKEVALIQATKARERSRMLLEMLTASMKGCEPLSALFQKAADADAMEGSRILLDGAVPSLEACGCRLADLDRFEAAFVLLETPDGPPVGWLPLRNTARASGRTVRDLVEALEAKEPAP